MSISGLSHRQHRMFGGFRNGVAPTSDTVHRYVPIPSGTWDPPIVPSPPVSGPPEHRYAHSVVGLEGIVGFVGQTYFGGRETNGDALNDTWGLQVGFNHLGADRSYLWNQVSSQEQPPDARSDHVAIAVRDTNRTMVIHGGLDQDSTALGDVWRLHRTTGTFGLRHHWDEIFPSGTAPPARFGHTAIFDDTPNTGGALRKRMIVAGGRTSPGGALADTSVWELRFDETDPAVATWYRMPQIDLGHGFPAPRYWHTLNRDPVARSHASKDATTALMFGGRLDDGSDSGELWAMWIFRDGTIGWQRRDTVSSTNPPHARSRHSAAFDVSQGGGRLYIYGGQRGSAPADSSAFIVDTWQTDRTWKRWSNLGFSLSAHTAALDPNTTIARTAEVYDHVANQWTPQTNLHMYEATYPPSFLVPGGALDSSLIININTDNRETYWTNVPASGQAGPWRRLSEGATGFRPKTGVQYRPGQILAAGGYGSSGATGETITMISSDLEWEVGDPMGSRTHHNLVALPTGQVLAVGGNNHATHFDQNPVKRPQIWTPNASGGGGSWTSFANAADTLAEQPTARTDHSTAVLLPDGRVLSAGGETAADKFVANIYCPPYLFEDDGSTLAARPTIQGVPPAVTWGTAFSVCVADTARIRSACLIAPGATTHSVDMNQRFIPLSILAAKANPYRLHLSTPASPDSAPPGYYMLFVLGSDDGEQVPSVAKWVQVNSSTTPAPDELLISAELITCDAIGPICWAAPDDDGCASRALDYDLRYSFSQITSSNFLSATPLSAIPDPATGTTSQTAGGISGLSPNTLVYFAGRTRSSAGNWSPLAFVEFGTLGSCGGGGYGTSARQARDEVGGPRDPASESGAQGLPDEGAAPQLNRRAESNSMSGASTLRLVGAFSTGSSFGWRLHYLDLATDEVRLVASSSSMVFEERGPSGAWETRNVTSVAGGLAGVRRLPREGRLIFPAGTTFEAIESDPQRFTLEAASHTELGEIATGDTGRVALSLAPDDTLDLTFRQASSEGHGDDCLFIVSLPGAVGSSTARRTGRTQSPGSPDLPGAESMPVAFALHPARPNPFSGETSLRFDLPVAARVRIEIFDVQGRRVAKFVDQSWPAGRHAVAWSGRLDRGEVARAGVYLCRMTAGEFVTERRITKLP